jgi:hypothetical protein
LTYEFVLTLDVATLNLDAANNPRIDVYGSWNKWAQPTECLRLGDTQIYQACIESYLEYNNFEVDGEDIDGESTVIYYKFKVDGNWASDPRRPAFAEGNH